MSIKMKTHYLIKQLKGFENILGDKVASIELDGNNKLIIELKINPEINNYLMSNRIDATVTYNLTNDTFKTACKGKGSRKYNSNVKQSVKAIIESCKSEAEKTIQGDVSESIEQTILYYYEQLKAIIDDNKEFVKVANEFNYKAKHECETVKEIIEVFEELSQK